MKLLLKGEVSLNILIYGKNIIFYYLQKKLITYGEWINGIEENLIKENLKDKFHVNIKFDKVYSDNLKPSNNDHWVIFNSKNT